MSKEEIIQQKLFEPFGGANQQLGSRRTMARNGHLPNGSDLSDLQSDTLGNLINRAVAPRIVIGNENPSILINENVAIAGGWCALRTADVENINKGILINPITGSPDKITSVQQVADWIESSIAFDQVVEAIGALTGKEYVAVSEQKLWSDRIISKTAKALGRSLNDFEQILIKNSVESAEKKRAEMTQKYLRLVTGNNNLILKRAVDQDFIIDLTKARDEMLKFAGISVQELQEMFPNQAEIIPSQTLIWAMYSEPYFQALRDNNYISSPIAIISEPTFHTFADDPAGAFLVNLIYQKLGRYFDPNGFNSKTGFIAFMECIQANGSSVRKKLTVDKVPNISNWQHLFNNNFLDPALNLDIDPARNSIFLWALNFIPFGTSLEIMLKLIDIKQQYRDEIKKTKVKSKEEADILKAPFLQQVNILNAALSQELEIFFERMTESL